MAKEILHFELNTGAKIPSVGLGTWQSEPGVVGQAVEAAIKIGYRHIDCARAYNNEKEIGEVLKKLFDDKVVKREDLFITSKLWCTDHAPEDVTVALGKTLEELQLEYVDLYLIHWPVRMAKGSIGFEPENLVRSDIPSTWKAMEALYDSGKARAIGVSNFYVKKLGDLLSVARIPPAANQIGLVLKKLFDDGVVKREDLFITSKLWSRDHAPEDVPVALNKTLEDLQLDYIDLYLIHWPLRMKKDSAGFGPENLVPTDIPGTWKAMEALYDSGKARAIGVSNFSVKKLGNLLDIARIPPAVDQVECHPSWQQPKLREFCETKRVHLSGYSPLGSPGTSWLKSEVLQHPVLVSTAEKLGKTPAQIALRWGLQMGHSVLPKSVNESRIKENFDVFSWSIPDDLFSKFSDIEQARLVRGTFAVHETLSEYKTVEELWDGEI